MLDSTGTRHLGKWFASKGAVRSAERVQRSSSRAVSDGWSGSSGDRLPIPPLSAGYRKVVEGDDIQPSDSERPTADYLDVGSVEDKNIQPTGPAHRRGLHHWCRGRCRTTPGGPALHGQGPRHCIIRFVGTIKTRPQLGVRIGVALDTQTGLNSRTADGTQHFECRDGHGVFPQAGNVQPVSDLLEAESGSVFGFGAWTDVNNGPIQRRTGAAATDHFGFGI